MEEIVNLIAADEAASDAVLAALVWRHASHVGMPGLQCEVSDVSDEPRPGHECGDAAEAVCDDRPRAAGFPDLDDPAHDSYYDDGGAVPHVAGDLGEGNAARGECENWSCRGRSAALGSLE